MASSACSRSRWRWRCKPKVLLLDEPAAGVPQSETPRIEQALAGLPADLAVLMIEHDMDLVFRFARRVIVLAAGAIIFDGSPGGGHRGCARARSLSRELCRCPQRRLRSAGLTAGYGPTRVIEDVSFAVPAGARLAVLGRNGMGKTTLLATLAGQTRRHGGEIRLAGREIAPLDSAVAGPHWPRLRAAGALHLPVADGRGEPVRRPEGPRRARRSRKPMRCSRA